MASSKSRSYPRIGILGIMQDLYDDMIPGIAQRQEGYAAELAAHLSVPGAFEFVPAKAIKYREDAERVMREFEVADLDGVLVVMLTYGPAMRVARLLVGVPAAHLPGQHPARAQRDPGLGHGRHDLQPGRARGAGHGERHGAGRAAVQRAHRRLARRGFRADVHRWARAAAAVTAWRRLRVALFGYAMNDMGDIRVDESRPGPVARPGDTRGRAR